MDNFTDPRLYSAFSNAPFQVTAQVMQQFSGDCREQSYLDKRDDAWRCVANSEVYDPCFINKHTSSNSLICPLSPWQSDAVLIRIDAPLDNSRHLPLDMSKTEPWAVELTDGKRCKRLSSPMVEDNGEPAYYDCGQNTFLVGKFYRCKSFWEVYLKQDTEYRRAYVKRAWF